jgi:hypothetical protein
MSTVLGRSRAVAVAITIVLIGAGLAILVESLPARGEGVEVDASSSLAVSATAPYKFVQPTYEQLPTNTTITVTFTDLDTLPHTFSVLDREGWVIPNSASTDLAALFSKYGALVNLNASGSSSSTGSFLSPGPGWYEFVCLEAGHFLEGMYGFVAFGMNLPSNLTVSAPAAGPGTVVFIIIGTIVALVVVAIVLGFVAGRRRGSEFEMPPERLGYAEPPLPEGNEPPTQVEKPKG